jgi:hypothetical protein
MPEAATSVVTWSTEQMMLEMVHDRVATVVTRVVWKAAVLQCGKQMEKLPHYYFSWIVCSRNRYICEMLPVETKHSVQIERGSTRSHSMENSVWKRLRTCRKTDYRMNEVRRPNRTLLSAQLLDHLCSSYIAGLNFVIYRAYTKEWCGFNCYLHWNRTILLCTPCMCVRILLDGDWEITKSGVLWLKFWIWVFSARV